MRPIKFYLVTDTHYFENELGAGEKPLSKICVRSSILLKKAVLL